MGVNHRSVLLDLQYFDMCSGALLPDVMHDVLEGALQYEVKLLLQYCIREKHYFSVSDLNEAIEGMELGYMECDQPAPITSQTIFATCSNSLKQKGMSMFFHQIVLSLLPDRCFSHVFRVHFAFMLLATQMWTLARLLPLMVGDHVPIEDDHWENFLLMLTVSMKIAHSIYSCESMSSNCLTSCTV